MPIGSVNTSPPVSVTSNVKSVKFVPADGDTENGPDYRVFAATVEFGAAWKK